MAVDPALNCPTCGRAWPERKGRVCSQCGLPIKLHDKWQFVGSRVQHRDCTDPKMHKLADGLQSNAQATLIETPHVD